MIQVTENDAANTRAIMELVGSFLVFLAAVFTIINDRMNRAKNVKGKERVVSATFGIVGTGFAAAGLTATMAFGAGRVALCLFVISAVVSSIDYLRATGPASRVETFQLIFFLVSVAWLASAYEIGRLMGITEHIIGVLEKLTK